MKLGGYDANKVLLTDKALWWKSHNIHVIEKLRQLRGRVCTGMKKTLSEVSTSLNLIFSIYVDTNNCCL